MSRKCSEIPLNWFKNNLKITTLFQLELFVDCENKEEIFALMQNYMHRFRSSLYVMILGNYNNDLYGKENVSDKSRNMTAIKFKHGKNENPRIYCKEFFDSKIPNYKKVVMISSYNKKTDKIDKKLKNFIETINNYEYEF